MLEAVVPAFALQPACQPGQVLEANRGGDYTLNICGIGIVGFPSSARRIFRARDSARRQKVGVWAP